MSDLPQGYHMLAVASMEAHGFHAATGEAVIWLTSPEGLKVCLTCDMGALHRVMASIEDHRVNNVLKAGLRVLAGGKAD